MTPMPAQHTTEPTGIASRRSIDRLEELFGRLRQTRLFASQNTRFEANQDSRFLRVWTPPAMPAK